MYVVLVVIVLVVEWEISSKRAFINMTEATHEKSMDILFILLDGGLCKSTTITVTRQAETLTVHGDRRNTLTACK